MFNLLNGELYKLQKSRGFFICCMTAIAFIIFMYGCLKMANGLKQQETQGQAVAVVVVEEEETLGIIDMEEMMLSAVGGIFLSVFACIFVNGEYGEGAIKNIIGKGVAREKVFLAKYLITIFATILMFLVILIATLLCGILFMGTKSLDAEFVQNLCQYGGMQLLFEIAFVSLVILVEEICRNIGIGVAISLGLIMLAGHIFSGLDALLSFMKMDFKISDYWIGNLISEVCIADINHDIVVRGFAAVIFWIMVALIGGILHIKTADVK